MSLIGACRFIAACASCMVSAAVLLPAQNCAEPGLNASQRLSRFRDLDQQAQTAMQQKRFKQAVELYREAVCLAPESPRGLYGLGVAEAASGDYAHARESLQKADRLQPASPLPLMMRVRVDFASGDHEELKADLRAAAERFASNAQLHTALSRFLAQNKLPVLALAESLRARQSAAIDDEARLQLAVLENDAGAYADAIQNARAIQSRPGNPNALRAAAAGVAGLSLESSGQRSEAVAHLQEAIRLDPSRENSYLALADIFEKAGKYGDAADILQQARAKFPGSAALLLPLGADLIRSEKYREGIDVLHDLLKQSPREAQAYLSIADAAHKMGDTAQELESLRELARREPSYPMIHVLIARAMLGANPVDYTKALDELAQAEKAAPLDPDVFYLRGKAYIGMNRYDDAIAALRRSIKLRPFESGPYYQLARLYQKLGKADLAKEQFQRLKYLESAPSGQ